MQNKRDKHCMNSKFVPAILALEDGSIFKGKSLQKAKIAIGEIVFNTAMSGYQEILTDPSYAGQMVTFTYPHIGNVGINEHDTESDRVHAVGLIIRSLSPMASNYRSQKTLNEYLIEQNCVLITEIDTRALTQKIRSFGAMKACIMTADTDSEQINHINTDKAIQLARSYVDLETKDFSLQVSSDVIYEWTEPSLSLDSRLRGNDDSNEEIVHVVVFDFGVKKNILRSLIDVGCKVTVVPADTEISKVLALKPDGIVLSNGPGDPTLCKNAISNIRKLLEYDTPILGICLGHQLLALALNAKTVKMKFGHHGANHPIQSLETGQVFITSQNHGFRVEDHSLPTDIKITHRSLFDGTLQGMRHRTKPLWSFQGHPEASPGPHDVKIIFSDFLQSIKRQKTKSHAKDVSYA